MKKFIKRLLLFLSPLLLIFICGEIRLRTINSYYKQKINGLKKSGSEIQILILGSSHTGSDCNPEYFSRPAFNMGFGWQNFYYDQKILGKELDNMPKLKYVILDVSYHNFYNSNYSVRSYFYKYYYDIDPFQKESFWKQNLSHFLFLYDPATAFQVMFSRNQVLTYGFEKQDTTMHEFLTDSWGKNKVALWREWSDQSGSSFDVNKVILEQMIETIQKRGITPVLVTPTLSSYVNKYLEKSISEKNHRVYDELVTRYHVPYFDLENASGFTDEDFYDMDHLNLKGSIKFTKILDSLINQYH